jgi:hypothetical protein
MAKSSPSKFSLQSVIIAAVVSALIAGTAVYLWRKQEMKRLQDPRQNNSQYLEIPELGVRVKTPDSLSLAYKLEPKYQFEDDSIMAAVSLRESNAPKECSAGYFGILAKRRGALPDDFKRARFVIDQDNHIEYFVKQFDGFHIFHVAPQNGCQAADWSHYPSKEVSESVVRALHTLELSP